MSALLKVAQTAPAAYRFGGKVFLAWLLANGVTREQLAQAWANGDAEFSRADMVEVMDPAVVRASAVNRGDATAHFIRVSQ